jgi:2'-5' RNA ligase
MSPSPSASIRLFIGIYPPAPLARWMLEAIGAVQLPPHRAVPAEHVHLTLQFIGDTPRGELPATVESMERSAAGLRAFELTVQRLITLPERGPRRLIAACTDAPGILEELKRRLVTRLARPGERRSRRPFRPHLTLARFRKPTPGPAIDHPLEQRRFPVDRIVLMRSTLRPEGAQHTEVAHATLLPPT